MTCCGTLTQSPIKNNVYFHVYHFSAVSGKAGENMTLNQTEQSVGSRGHFALHVPQPWGCLYLGSSLQKCCFDASKPPCPHPKALRSPRRSVGVMTEIPIARCAAVVIEQRGTRFPHCVETHSVVHETSPPAVGLCPGGEWGHSTSSCGSLLSSVSPAPAVTCPAPQSHGEMGCEPSPVLSPG